MKEYYTSIDWESVARISTIATSVLAIIVSIIALNRNTKFSNKNITLSIQQAVFKMVIDKAKDCNSVWLNEPKDEMNGTSPHFLIITEFIVAIDIINKAFELFGKNLNVSEFKKTYYYLYWKQLLPDIRGFVMERAKEIAKRVNDDVYTNQINSIHSTFSDFFENK